MAQPTPYEREFNFANQQAATPLDPLPGAHIDAELNRIKRTTDEVLANLELIQTDEGTLIGSALADNSVGFDQLAPDVVTNINTDGGTPEAFAAALENALPDSDEFNDALDLKLTTTELVDELNAVSGEINIQRTTEGNFWTTLGVEPFVHRMRDRVFIGNAVGMGPARSNSNTTWVPATASGANWIPRDSQLISMSDNGTLAISGGSRVSDGTGIAGGTAPIGVTGFIINDGSEGRAAWAFYADIQHEPSVGTNSYGIEIAAKNKHQDQAANPYDRTSGVYGVWLAGGGDAAYGGDPDFPSNTGVMFLKSSNPLSSGWNVGINFDDESLTFTAGLAPAIRMAKGHCIEWWAPEGSGTKGAFITSAVDDDAAQVQLLFNDNTVAFLGVNGKNIASFNHVASAVNYVAFTNATTGNLPSIVPAGDDANEGLFLSGKGTGSLYMAAGNGSARLRLNNTGMGFFATSPVAQKTGWGVATGTATRTTFDTTTVTTAQLAERVKALIDDLHSTAGYGVITT